LLFGEVVTTRIYLNARSTNAFKKPFVLNLESGFVLGASNFKEAIRFDYKGGGIISKKYLHTACDLPQVSCIIKIKHFIFRRPTYLIHVIVFLGLHFKDKSCDLLIFPEIKLH
jgi:hypothetical protein